jgi:hypothetical protein
MPGPSDYTESGQPYDALYHNSDFYNNIFVKLWSSDDPNSPGRGDLYRFKEKLGVNFIHCYDWAAPVGQNVPNKGFVRMRDHTGFFNLCDSLQMKVTIPISNHTIKLLKEGKESEAKDNFSRIIGEVYSYSPPPTKHYAATGMWKIFNEYEFDSVDRNPAHVVTVMAWIADWETKNGIGAEGKLPVMVCTSFGMKGGIEGAGYLKDVWDVLIGSSGNQARPPNPELFWKERVVFGTNPQREGAAIRDYLNNRLPTYWRDNKIPMPPVMFTELGSNIADSGGTEQTQADWLKEQIAASKPGSYNGMMMLGACIFLNQEQPWRTGSEKTFGLMRFGADSDWGKPVKNSKVTTTFPVKAKEGWHYEKQGVYLVEQQTPKLNYKVVREAFQQWG